MWGPGRCCELRLGEGALEDGVCPRREKDSRPWPSSHQLSRGKSHFHMLHLQFSISCSRLAEAGRSR